VENEYITVVVAILASGSERRSRGPILVGPQQATRKNPHAIDVGSRPDIQHSCWYIIWMEISTTAV
jgi:hypothetical protein